MVSQSPPQTQSPVFYPDSDGQPIANNTVQFRWIVVIQQNLEWLFAENPSVFVAGDLFWYPVEGRNTIVTAPDVLVVFGRPKGDPCGICRAARGSYKQWVEDNIPPQVVFEILSPSNTADEMDRKLLFYERYGVEEYYIYDPDTAQLRGLVRGEDGLDVITPIHDWVSPRLGVRFDLSGQELQLYRPDGDRFLSYTEIAQRAEQERQRADQEQQRADQERQRADQERQRADQERQSRLDAIPRLLQIGLSAEQVAEALGLSVAAVQAQIQPES